ncbi:GIY-YIG catalytic domain-containing endonuclease [Acanthocystis turfacea Chlorella virus Br0604L]|nr:GIY-YIG catalytic domain-containing endonuclease [Acanthocystis turfacea Chlorella virus Br0604L]
MGFIYRLTSPSGKSYIGQTIRPIETRLEEHQLPYSKCVAIYNAIEHYGWANIKKEWYEVPDEDLNFYEEMLVALLGTLAPCGYNLMEGGGSSGKPSEESRKKMSDAHKGEKSHMYGKTLSYETKQKMSDAHKGEKNPMHGKTPSAETKQKMSEAQKGEKSHMYRKTLTDETKRKMSDAKTGEKHYLYGKSLSDETKQKLSIAKSGKNNPLSKKVYQYDISGAFVRSFDSSEEAAKFLNKKTGGSIRRCARGESDLAHGFGWSYTEM